MQVLLKTMEYCLFLILFFQGSLLFFECRDVDDKGIAHIFCPSTFAHTFGHKQW